MRSRKILFTLAFCFAAFAVCFAQEAQMGTWKLNEAKSKFPSGDNVKVSVVGTEKDGMPTHNEWTGKFDGKPYDVTGDATSEKRAYTKVNDHKLTFTGTSSGKKTLIGVVTVSADGKTRTVVTKTADGKGGATAVYDKQ